MRLASIARPRSRPRGMAGIDALVGAALLCGAALMILPGMAAFATCVTIAGATRLLPGRAKPQIARIR